MLDSEETTLMMVMTMRMMFSPPGYYLFLAAEGPGPAAAAAPAAAVGVAGRVAEARARPAATAAAGAGAPLEPRLAAPLAPLLARLLALFLALLAAGDLVAPLLAELLAGLLAGVLRLRRLGLVVRHADDGRREALLLELLRDAHRVHGADHRQRALVGVDLHRLDPWSRARTWPRLFCHSQRHEALLLERRMEKLDIPWSVATTDRMSLMHALPTRSALITIFCKE